MGSVGEPGATEGQQPDRSEQVQWARPQVTLRGRFGNLGRAGTSRAAEDHAHRFRQGLGGVVGAPPTLPAPAQPPTGRAVDDGRPSEVWASPCRWQRGQSLELELSSPMSPGAVTGRTGSRVPSAPRSAGLGEARAVAVRGQDAGPTALRLPRAPRGVGGPSASTPPPHC